MVKVAAILIVKGSDDEAKHLKRCLESIKGHIDGIFININSKAGHKPSQKVVDVAKSYTDNIITTEWHDHFGEARNLNLAQVPKDYDWCLWLDSDDTVDHPEKIREVAEKSEKFDCIYVDYEYAHDQAGNVTTVHMVARLFQNNGSHHWNPKTRIHETLVQTRSAVQGMTKDFTVVHHAQEARTIRSFERNIKLLERQLEDESNDPDPRTMYYLACTYYDAGNLDAAKDLLDGYLRLSGWDQERSVALTKLGKIYLEQGDRAEAKKAYAWATAEDPENPEPYVELASLEVEMESYKKAATILTRVENMSAYQTTLERNPLTTTFRTFILLAECYLNMGGANLDKAAKYAKKALKYKPNDPKVKSYVESIVGVNASRKELKKYIDTFKEKKDAGNTEGAQQVLDSIPEYLADNPVVAQLRQAENPFIWPQKSIAIMTGDTALDAWGPWSLAEGIGGSEEAIIRLAPKLAKLGYKVVVYGKPGAKTGMYDGVVWRNFWDCNLKDEFDIFVAWRAPFIFDHDIKANKKYLWLHDVMEAGEFTEKRIANFDKCIVLSKYHRSLFPMIPEDKILMSGNGIDPEDFAQYDDKITRKPNKLFYGSSHVRGLVYLYEIWNDLKKEIPDLTLDVYYGRESYDKVHRGNPERMKWMDDMIAKAKELDGVTDHGKIGQDEIVRKMFESSIWVYPCPFPEIYCITAIKAQASGCIPVGTDFAALNETIQFGSKLHIPNNGEVGRADDKFLEDYKALLLAMLRSPEQQEAIRPEMIEWARSQSWDAIASQWDEAFSA